MKKIVHPVKSQLFSRPFINKSCCWESMSACVTTRQAFKRCSACGRWLSVVTISIPKAKIFSFPLLHIQYFRTEENWIGNISTCFVLWPTGDCCLRVGTATFLWGQLRLQEIHCFWSVLGISQAQVPKSSALGILCSDQKWDPQGHESLANLRS